MLKNKKSGSEPPQDAVYTSFVTTLFKTWIEDLTNTEDQRKLLVDLPFNDVVSNLFKIFFKLFDVKFNTFGNVNEAKSYIKPEGCKTNYVEGHLSLKGCMPSHVCSQTKCYSSLIVFFVCQLFMTSVDILKKELQMALLRDMEEKKDKNKNNRLVRLQWDKSQTFVENIVHGLQSLVATTSFVDVTDIHGTWDGMKFFSVCCFFGGEFCCLF